MIRLDEPSACCHMCYTNFCKPSWLAIVYFIFIVCCLVPNIFFPVVETELDLFLCAIRVDGQANTCFVSGL